jgi:hypothetical protein
MAVIKSELIDAQIENVAVLPAYGKRGRLVYLTTNNTIYRDDVTSWTPITGIEIQDYRRTYYVGKALQQFAGHDLALDDFPNTAKVVALYNLNDANDLSANANNLINEDAYNGIEGILEIANSAHLGIAGEHLNNDAIAGLAAGGDISITIGGWHSGAIASSGLFGLGLLTDTKIQYYTDANKYVVFDVAGNLGISVTKLDGSPSFHHIVLSYNKANSTATAFIDGKIETTFTCTTNLNISATPKVCINSKTDGTLENQFRHDECFIYDGTLDIFDVLKIYSWVLPIPTVLQGKEFFLNGIYANSSSPSMYYQFIPEIVYKDTTKIFMKPSNLWVSGDYKKIIGRL